MLVQRRINVMQMFCVYWEYTKNNMKHLECYYLVGSAASSGFFVCVFEKVITIIYDFANSPNINYNNYQ